MVQKFNHLVKSRNLEVLLWTVQDWTLSRISALSSQAIVLPPYFSFFLMLQIWIWSESNSASKCNKKCFFYDNIWFQLVKGSWEIDKKVGFTQPWASSFDSWLAFGRLRPTVKMIQDCIQYTPVKNDYICSWRLRVSEWYGGHRIGIHRVMKHNFFDLSEGILRNLVF